MSDNTSETMDRLRLNNADDIAVLLEEHLRIEDGHIEGKSFVAVKIAEEYEAEIDRIDAFTRLFLQKAEDEIEQLRHMNRTMFKRDEGQRAEIERLNAKADTWITTAGQNAEAADRLAAEIDALHRKVMSLSADRTKDRLKAENEQLDRLLSAEREFNRYLANERDRLRETLKTIADGEPNGRWAQTIAEAALQGEKA